MTNDALAPAGDLAGRNTIHLPNESPAYRSARQTLLAEEIELRRHMERVAAMRRALPPGGEVPEDYRFVAESGDEVRLSELFGPHDTLVVYSYMFGPDRAAPCPMCTSLMSSLEHHVVDLQQRVGVAFTARSPIERLVDAKHDRGWRHLPVYSDVDGGFTRAYVNPDDGDSPAYNVFTRRDGTIRHFWADEIGFDMADPGQDPRGALQLDSLWLVLDSTPDGRGAWYPELTY